uniref:Uncharacterized protein n=1 Tax=Panagrolaimus sp. ES5 TaxID=591445 RepID=A0AC34FZS8_9BILA
MTNVLSTCRFEALVYGNTSNKKHGNVSELNFDIDNGAQRCATNTTFFSTKNISYAYGLFADCSVFIFDTADKASWGRIQKMLSEPLASNHICYGNDFILDLQFDEAGTPSIFVLDKNYFVFSRVQMPSRLDENGGFYLLDSQINLLENGLTFGNRRESSKFYQPSSYGIAGTVTGKAISLIWPTDSGYHINIGIREDNYATDFKCLIESPKHHQFPPIYIDYIPASDWRASVLDAWNTKADGQVTEDERLEKIAWLWIVCLSATIFAVFIAILTGLVMNWARKAQIKLEVAVEALLASSCTNLEHQLRRSALLNKCGFPSVELNDTNITTANITTAGSLQDDTNGMQTVNEYDVLAEQIRRVQAAQTPEKSDKSGTNSTQSSKR